MCGGSQGSVCLGMAPVQGVASNNALRVRVFLFLLCTSQVPAGLGTQQSKHLPQNSDSRHAAGGIVGWDGGEGTADAFVQWSSRGSLPGKYICHSSVTNAHSHPAAPMASTHSRSQKRFKPSQKCSARVTPTRIQATAYPHRYAQRSQPDAGRRQDTSDLQCHKHTVID